MSPAGSSLTNHSQSLPSAAEIVTCDDAGCEGDVGSLSTKAPATPASPLNARMRPSMETGARWKMEPVHLEDVVGEVIIAHGPEAEDRGVRLKLSGEAGQVWGLEPLISRAVGNIIENAIRHAPVGSRWMCGCGLGRASTVWR
jgi:hypothetical protein